MFYVGCGLRYSALCYLLHSGIQAETWPLSGTCHSCNRGRREGVVVCVVLKASAEKSIAISTQISLAKASLMAMPAINGTGNYVSSTERSAASHIAKRKVV